MKYKIIFVNIVLFIQSLMAIGLESNFSAAPAMKTGCLITVVIEGFPGGKVKFLGITGNHNYLIIPEFVSTGQKIVIEQKEPFPSGLYYLVFAEKNYIQILLDTDQHFSMHAKNSDLINSMHVEGSVDNKLLYQSLRYESSYKKKIDEIRQNITDADRDKKSTIDLEKKLDAIIIGRRNHIQEFAKIYPDSFFTKFKLAGQNPVLENPTLPNGDIDKEKQVELYKEKYWDNYDFNDMRLLKTPVYHNKLKQYIKELTPQRINDVIESADFIMQKVPKNTELCMYTASYICLEYSKTTIMGGEAIYVHMVDNYLNDEFVVNFDKKEIEKARDDADKIRPSLIGKIGQNITCLSPEDRPLSLYDLDSPIVVLYIYNVLCEHCIEETPEMFEVYMAWQDKGVDVFALATNRDVDIWKDYVAKENLTWHNAIDSNYKSKYYKKYRVDITPEIYVLNSNREIIGMNLKPHQLDSIFEKEFSK